MRRTKIGIIVLVLSLWAGCIGVVSAEETKKLYFEETKGTMTWNPVRGSDGNWFMDFTNMIPGGKYEDNLQIENGSNKAYKLYVQAVPLEQDEEQNRLLEAISMKVSLDNNELYNGTASGKEYEDGNLQDVIYLGTYKAGEKSQIAVELELNKNIGIEYSDKLTRSDWKFMVTEVKQSDPTPSEKGTPQVIQAPKTGDTTNLKFYQALLAASLLFIVGLAASFRKRRDLL